MFVISSLRINVCLYFIIRRNERCKYNLIFYNDYFNMVVFGMFVNIIEIDIRVRIYV